MMIDIDFNFLGVNPIPSPAPTFEIVFFRLLSLKTVTTPSAVHNIVVIVVHFL